jgi:hypothetical protein
LPFPVILVNSSTGSDSLASGAGPGTALTGTNASTSGDGLTVTLDGSPDLSGVAVDGSHVIYLVDATAGARNFGKITAKDDGADTVTVSNAFGLSLSGKSWAIGGKRAAVDSATSRKLRDNNSAAGDAMPGWTLEMESGHTETITGSMLFRRAGDVTDGPITFRGALGAATRPMLTFTFNNNGIDVRGNFVTVKDFDGKNTNATKTASTLATTTSNIHGVVFQNLRAIDSTDKFFRGIMPGNACSGSIRECEIAHVANSGLLVAHSTWIIENNDIHHCGANGILTVPGTRGTWIILGNRVHNNTADGIGTATSLTTGDLVLIIGNTIDNNGGDGIEIGQTPAIGMSGWAVVNNILSDNGGYGLHFSAAGSTAAALNATGIFVSNNDTFSNTSGAYLPAGYGLSDPGLDPQFVDAAGRNFAIGTNLKAQGYPEGLLGVGCLTESFVDIGAAQREETGAAATVGHVIGGAV